MSLKDNEQIVESINYFNSLPDERKVAIVRNPSSLEAGDAKLGTLILAILEEVSDHNKDVISTTLHELGLDKTFATLLVDNLAQVHTIKYLLGRISEISDDDFKIKFSALVNDLVIERKPQNDVLKEHEITADQRTLFYEFIVGSMNNLSAGHITEKRLVAKCKECNVSDFKTNLIIEEFKTHLPYWRSVELFSIVRRLNARVSSIEGQNEVILKSLKDLLTIVKSQTDTGSLSHFQ